MPGTQYFKDKQKTSLNSFSNGENVEFWQPDQKYIVEVKDVLKKSNMELE